MSRAANLYWVDQRIQTQHIAPRTATSFPRAREISLDLIGSRTEVRQRGGIIPPWVIFGMIILGTLALCVTVTMRTHAERQAAANLYQQLQHDVEAQHRSNTALQTELQRLQSDPRAIESAARSQLNMARPDEVIVPVE